MATITALYGPSFIDNTSAIDTPPLNPPQTNTLMVPELNLFLKGISTTGM